MRCGYNKPGRAAAYGDQGLTDRDGWNDFPAGNLKRQTAIGPQREPCPVATTTLTINCARRRRLTRDDRITPRRIRRHHAHGGRSVMPSSTGIDCDDEREAGDAGRDS